MKPIEELIRKLEQLCDKSNKTLVIIEGEATGADSLAAYTALRRGHEVRPFPAHWGHTHTCLPGCREVIGKPAGPIRNSRMLEEGKPDVVFAFFVNRKNSKGTSDMVAKAVKVVPTYTFESGVWKKESAF